MHEDWTTENYDLEAAEKIINKHVELNEGEPLGLIEIIFQDEKSARCELSPWLIELAEHYSELYGLERGLMITQKIITRCIIGDTTIH